MKNTKLFQIFSRQEAKEIPVASVARWEEHLRLLMILEREARIVGYTDGGQDETAESRS